MKLGSADAFQLGQALREMSIELGNYRFEHWNELTAAQRQFLEDEEWSLLNAASDSITKAVGLVLDESETSFKDLLGAVTKAKKAVKTLKTVKKVINVAAAAVALSAAVIAKDPGAVGKNAKALLDAATADT